MVSRLQISALQMRFFRSNDVGILTVLL